MTRIVAPSRLHFGLLNAGNIPGVPQFGGCGLMIDSPGVAVRVEPASTWIGSGPNAERAVEYAKRVTTECHQITVESCPPEHVGLGVGTALGLAVAKAIRPTATATELAKLIGRGARSGIGLHGFEQGGFILDGGKLSGDALPTLTRRLAFPVQWRVVLVRGPEPSPWHGTTERGAFARIDQPDDISHHTELSRVMHRLETSVEQGENFEEFAEAIHGYNRDAGRWFAAVQGGTYSSTTVEALIERIRGYGLVGVGQTSWGPTVFAFAADPDHSEWLADRLRQESSDLIVHVAAAANRGAEVIRQP